jgi:hypothetical protein
MQALGTKKDIPEKPTGILRKNFSCLYSIGPDQLILELQMQFRS